MPKYVMSDKEDYLEIDLEEVIEFFATKKLHSQNEMKYPLGFNSPLMHIPSISLYDDSLLMEKYPNGVVTENFVLIPSDKFKEIKEKSTGDIKKRRDGTTTVKTNMQHFKILLNEFMLAFVEMSLNVEVTNEEKLKINKDLQMYVSENKEIKINDPEKVTNRELLKVIEGKGYAFEDKVRHAPDLSLEVKETLKINESYVENINSIKQKIQEVSIQKINSNITIEEFINLIEKSGNHLISPVLPLKIVNQKINEVLEQNEPDIKKFIEQSEKQVFPFLVKLPPLQFKSSMELIFKEAFGGMENYSKRFPDLNISERKKDFASALVKNLDSLQREYLITVITGFDALSKDIVSSNDPNRRIDFKMK